MKAEESLGTFEYYVAYIDTHEDFYIVDSNGTYHTDISIKFRWEDFEKFHNFIKSCRVESDYPEFEIGAQRLIDNILDYAEKAPDFIEQGMSSSFISSSEWEVHIHPLYEEEFDVLL